MKRSKRIVALLMSVIMLLSTLAGCGATADTGDYVTRAEWIRMLCEAFGMDEYVSTEGYFSDISPENELFNYVQSCVEWGVIDSEQQFEPDQVARVSFALESSLRAAEVEVNKDDIADYALQEGIVSGSGYLDLEGKLTREKATEILTWASKQYLYTPVEEYSNISLKEDVVDLTEKVQEIQPLSENQYLLSSEVGEYRKGDILVLPGTQESPCGVAKKVVDMVEDENGEYLLTLEDPEIEELCEELSFAATVVPEIEDVVPAEGVEIIFDNATNKLALSGNDQFFVTNLVNQDQIPVAEPTASGGGLNFSANINFTKGTVAVNRSWDSLFGMGENVKIGGEGVGDIHGLRRGLQEDAGQWFKKSSVIPDKNLFGPDPYDNTKIIEDYKAGKISLDDFKKKLNLTEEQTEKNVGSMENKFSGGYEITGSIAIKNLYVTPEVDLKKILDIPVGIDRVAVTLNYQIENSLTVKGKLSEELRVCSINVPIASTGAAVVLELYLCADLNGEITTKLVISNMTKIEYSGGNFKKNTEKESSLSAEGSLQLDAGPKFAVIISFLGIRIIDTDVKCIVRLKGSADIKYGTEYQEDENSLTINRKSTWGYELKGYVPIISAGIGNTKGTLANKLKISASWTLVGEKNAYCFEIIPRVEFVIWEESLVLPKHPEESDEIQTDDDQTEGNVKERTDLDDYLKIDSYYLTIDPGSTCTITITNLPNGYSEADLIWASTNENVATVNEGLVSTKNAGSCMISVTTKDGEYGAYCTVNVQDNYEIEFTPLEGVYMI